MIIKIKAKPNSKEEKIELKDGIYNISVKKQAIDGKANDALIKLLAKYFKVHQKDVIVRNPRSREKIIVINN